ncbi:HAD family hydrolase [Limimaricola pyoseonensis]|uniref:phosphoglycolate phosphatase n=1 Tax=Limimaricola pyoseonensis TaxID=521013 RepID=A0A1G7CUF9_9RHOB|nr:HAD family hydrolase [Limimaricola pyoseonensis]SDE42861.1 phosphoglycolate phosphatase [Limimaricola pyoseonensis]
MTGGTVGALRALVFDKDGTLFDFHATWSGWTRSLILSETRGDHARAALLAEALGFALEPGRFSPDSPVIASTAAEIAALVAPHLPAADRPGLLERMNALAAEAPQVPAAPLAPLLAEFRQRGLRLGVATNDSEAPARAHLGAAGVTAAFDFVAGADSGHGAKPGPGQLLAFARQVGLPPSACAMVGDSLHDLRAARAAGMTAIAVLTGIAGPDELAPEADAVLDSIAALPGWLEARNGA